MIVNKGESALFWEQCGALIIAGHFWHYKEKQEIKNYCKLQENLKFRHKLLY